VSRAIDVRALLWLCGVSAFWESLSWSALLMFPVSPTVFTTAYAQIAHPAPERPRRREEARARARRTA